MCIPKPLHICAYTQPSLILMFLTFDIVTKALLFGQKGMTFSYNVRCRKEGTIQNRYIQHIYMCDLNGRLPGEIVCPHIVLSFVVTCWERADLLALFVVSSVSLSLSHWYPGSGVVLDCIDS